MLHRKQLVRLLLGPALATTVLSGCARSARPKVAAPGEAEPIHDTIQEFRKGERIACAQGTDLVYVVSRDGGLHSFDPAENRFRRIGTLDCPGTRRSRPHSMAVDRSGQAWIGYDNGVVALASIVSGECTSSKVDVNRAHLGRRFGMGFAPTPQGEIGGETLFLTSEPEIAGITRDGRAVRGASVLARIDDGATISIAGQFPPAVRGLAGELSSRSDGKLFAFFAGDPFQLAEIDPATADVRWQTKLEGIRFTEAGSGSWAFAAVGSEFFFFWADHGGPSTVTRLKGDGSIEHVIKDAGIQIVGAGASTCATRTPKSVPSIAGVPSDPSDPSRPSLAEEFSPLPPEACECPLETPRTAPPAPAARPAPMPPSKLPPLPPASKLAPPRRPTPKPTPAPAPTPSPKRPRIPHAVMRD